MQNLLIVLAVTALFAFHDNSSLIAGDWLQFRGPHGGVASDSLSYPTVVGPTENVLWKTALPPGHSSPVIVGNRIVLTAVRDQKELITLALDRASGKVLWERTTPYERLESIHGIGSYAQSSPASDGQHIVVFFGSSGMVCFDLEGNQLWQVPMGPFNDDFGAASSPIIVDDAVVVSQDHDTDSFLALYDVTTGKQRWRTDRSQFSRNFGTPVVWEVDGRRQIVVAGTLRVCGYDWKTGAELWTVRGLSRVVCPTPAIGDDNTLYVAGWSAGGEPGERISLEPYADAAARLDVNKNGSFEKEELKGGPLDPRFTQCDRNKDGSITMSEYDEFRMLFDQSQNVVLAIEPGGSGDVTETHVKWRFERFVPFCSSPLAVGGQLFNIKDGGILTCLDAESGRALKTDRLNATGSYYASPVAAQGKIYLASQKGEVTVVSTEKPWDTLHTVDFGEEIYATPALVDGRIYLRTAGNLYCFGAE